MKLTPDQIAWADQQHAEAVRALEGLITAARCDTARNAAENQQMGEAEEVTFLAVALSDQMDDHPCLILPTARMLALAIYRLSRQP